MKFKNIKLIIFAIVMTFGFMPSVYAYCPLGPDVTKDLYGALKIINFAAPLLCIGFTIIDLVKSLTKGDAQSEIKPIAQKFAKRFIYTVILFFVPMLVDMFMQIAGVWGEDGACDLQNPTDNGLEENEETPEEANLIYEVENYYIELPDKILL